MKLTSKVFSQFEFDVFRFLMFTGRNLFIVKFANKVCDADNADFVNKKYYSYSDEAYLKTAYNVASNNYDVNNGLYKFYKTTYILRLDISEHAFTFFQNINHYSKVEDAFLKACLFTQLEIIYRYHKQVGTVFSLRYAIYSNNSKKYTNNKIKNILINRWRNINFWVKSYSDWKILPKKTIACRILKNMPRAELKYYLNNGSVILYKGDYYVNLEGPGFIEFSKMLSQSKSELIKFTLGYGNLHYL